MLAIIKRILIFVVWVFVVILMVVLGCGLRCDLLEKTDLYAGVNYPKKKFLFYSVNDGDPPGNASDRLKAGAAYPQAFIISIKHSGRSNNSFKMGLRGTIFVNKPYNVLHIKELRYEWEGNRGIFSKEQSIKLAVNEYVTENGWYWYGWLGNFFECDFFECNFEKLFVGKDVGDEFMLRLELVYSFDDEPEDMQLLEYKVKVIKGKYVPLFSGFG